MTLAPADPADNFQPSYRVSRERFLEKLHRLSARLPVRVDSRAIAPRGPEGETLALDFAIVGARRPKHALVLSSGTHGVEGYTGSALQHWALDALLPRLALAADTAIVLQHANNPYGFAWHRRVNEDNVDPNRNFRDAFDPGQCSPDYEALYDCLNPADLHPDNEARRWAEIQAYIDREGLRRFQQVAVEGQYKFPRGIQFGGHRRSAGTQHLIDLTREHLAAAQTVIWVDFHTGLGESGACELICGAPLDSPAYAFAQEIWAGEVRSSQAGESISTPLNGLLDLGLQAVLPAGARFAFAFPEYGTWPPERVIRAMRSDNWLHHHGDLGDAAGRAIKAEMLEAFRPASRDWMRTVAAHGIGLVERTVARLPGASMRG
ncbi:DUF2817 domain-containing protein [Zeimonas arvi]|uniref:DUF2817 domain-containing protein n=1 Tax=Zeimonas arvi TaxID=2498847 RepID=A0A5C8NUD3_9BURK|nr:DUF2817 domain-containing protein [Zeimonas arvi]TXL64783.1 DUF2817 domain-containing protein [Zeimonas arvi]